jgi:hypothetical protein
MTQLKMDNSKRAQFRKCKRKHFISEELGYKSNFGSTALRAGSTYHAMQEGYCKQIIQDPNSYELAIAAGIEAGKVKWDKESEGKTFFPDYRTFQNVCNLFISYIQYYTTDQQMLEIIKTEQKFECPLIPETEEEKKVFPSGIEAIFTGRIDLVVSMGGSHWIFDHKTTGGELQMTGSRLNRSAQLIGYTLAGRTLYSEPIEGSIVGLAHFSSYKSKKTGEYGELKTDFLRVPQIFSSEDIKQWKLQFFDTLTELVRAKESGQWPVDFDSCYQYGACTFIGICQQGRPVEECNFSDYHIEQWDVLDED